MIIIWPDGGCQAPHAFDKKTPKYQLVIRYQMYDDALIELMQYLNKKLTIDVFVEKNGQHINSATQTGQR